VSETPASGGGSGAPAPQRRWQAPCPNCGAPVEFQSAASVSAICGYCRSSVLRDGDALRKIGESAELLADRGLLQLGTSGNWQQRGFTLVGRVQYGYGKGGSALASPAEVEGSWSEWHALFDDGASGWLSEDNDQYVMSFAVRPDSAPPPPDTLSVGQPVELVRKQWRVASLVDASVLAAQGELQTPPQLGRSLLIADLRNTQNQVATLEYADRANPLLWIGVPARPPDLNLRNLREESVGLVAAQGFPCPHCGAPVEPKLSGTQSISCGACHSVIDLSQGVGAQLRSFQQGRRFTPKIPLGRSGQLALAGLPGLDWQVVGFARRRGIGNGTFTWDDYILYNAAEGFAFLNDTEDGWVGWRTLTGVPQGIGKRDNPDLVEWEGQRYRLGEAYQAEALYVEGEFYWKVQQGQRTRNFDYAGTGSASRRRLSQERSEAEVVWSQGGPIPAQVIGEAFRLSLQERAAMRPDVSPVSRGSSFSLSTVLWVVLILVVIIVLSECSGGGGGFYGTSGGAYGGYSTGGGHK
jgi:hypothetical protein